MNVNDASCIPSELSSISKCPHPYRLSRAERSRRAPSWSSWGRISHLDIHLFNPQASFSPNQFSISPQCSMSPSPQPNRGARGARARICAHCGRSFRRTEHLERHIRTRKQLPGRPPQLMLTWQTRHQGEAVHLFLWGGLY